jgi:hypothetical protein
MLHPVGFIEPCLPTNARSGPQWVYEIKHDGFRFVCWRAGDRVRVFSRQGNDWTDRVPLIAEAISGLRVKSARWWLRRAHFPSVISNASASRRWGCGELEAAQDLDLNRTPIQ